MLQEPNVGVLAARLQACINDALKPPITVAALRPDGQEVDSSPEPGRGPVLNGAERAPTGPEQIVPIAVDVRPERTFSSPSRPSHLLVLSATSREALETASGQLADRLEGLEDQELPDVSHALAVERSESKWRRAVVAGSRAEAIERLRKGTGKGVWSSSEPTNKRSVAFLLAGVGEQTAGAGRQLYESEPIFRAAADHCAEFLKPLLNLDIRELMFTASKPAGNWLRGGDGGVIKGSRVAQPAAFVLDWCWRRCG